MDRLTRTCGSGIRVGDMLDGQRVVSHRRSGPVTVTVTLDDGVARTLGMLAPVDVDRIVEGDAEEATMAETAYWMEGRMLDYQPGNGWRYAVVVSDLPADDFEGGNRDTHVLVSVWVPVDPALPSRVARTSVMERSGPLSDTYVAERFGTDLSEYTLGHVADAVRRALGRPAVDG